MAYVPVSARAQDPRRRHEILEHPFILKAHIFTHAGVVVEEYVVEVCRLLGKKIGLGRYPAPASPSRPRGSRNKDAQRSGAGASCTFLAHKPACFHPPSIRVLALRLRTDIPAAPFQGLDHYPQRTLQLT
ncbi:hypothetical protein HGRIS_001601 [Hohenbuehelia grisea]|uniref:Uncharacterized protein n=1 Tax=Hohenbuehelia grisea TaxID=104357 RepID=A0ABR3JIW0_9AGAR